MFVPERCTPTRNTGIAVPGATWCVRRHHHRCVRFDARRSGLSSSSSTNLRKPSDRPHSQCRRTFSTRACRSTKRITPVPRRRPTGSGVYDRERRSRVSIPLEVVSKDDVQLRAVGGPQLGSECLLPIAPEAAPCEPALERSVPLESEEGQHGGEAGPWIRDHVLVAHLQPRLRRDLRLRISERVDQPLPAESSQHDERPPRTLPLLLVLGREGSPRPVGRSLVGGPRHLQQGVREGPPVPNDVDETSLREHLLEEARSGPTRELVKEQGRALGSGTGVEESFEAPSEPRGRVLGGQIAERLGPDRGGSSIEQPVGLRGGSQPTPTLGDPSRPPAVEEAVEATLGVEDAEGVLDVRYESDVTMASEDIVDQRGTASAGAEDEGVSIDGSGVRLINTS